MTLPFTEIQQLISQVLPIVLIVPALVLAASGLFIWLAGIRWLKFIAALAGAFTGLICAWQFTDKNLIAVVMFAVIPVALGVFFHKPVAVLMAALLAAAVVVFLPLGLSALKSPQAIERRPYPRQEQQQTLDITQSIAKAQEAVALYKQYLTDYVKSIRPGQKSLALMIGVGVLGLGLLSWRIVCSAACSVLGTVFMSVGMLILLTCKGAEPLTIVKQNSSLVLPVAITMVILGTLLQYWISPKTKKKQDAKQILSEGGH